MFDAVEKQEKNGDWYTYLPCHYWVVSCQIHRIFVIPVQSRGESDARIYLVIRLSHRAEYMKSTTYFRIAKIRARNSCGSLHQVVFPSRLSFAGSTAAVQFLLSLKLFWDILHHSGAALPSIYRTIACPVGERASVQQMPYRSVRSKFTLSINGLPSRLTPHSWSLLSQLAGMRRIFVVYFLIISLYTESLAR